MGRNIDANKIGLVLKSLRECPKRYSELKTLGIPEQSLSRILKDYLSSWDLIEKDQTGRWRMKNMSYLNDDKSVALRHSRSLFDLFKEDHPRYAIRKIVFHENYEFGPTESLQVSGLFEHLMNGYSLDLRNQILRLKDIAEKYGLHNSDPMHSVSSLMEYPGESIPMDHFAHVLSIGQGGDGDMSSNHLHNTITKQEAIDYVKIFSDLCDLHATLSIKVKTGYPLEGHCQICQIGMDN